MGNTLRRSIGHMCGVQAAKECPDGDADRPVDKPKESKKKKKKSKRSKKLINDKLTSIKEENEGHNELHPNGKSGLSTGEGTENIDESHGKLQVEQSEKSEEPLEEAPEKDEHDYASISADGDEKIGEVSSDTPINDSCVSERETAIDGDINDYNGDNISLISTTDEEQSIMVCSFKQINAETLGIEEADEIFIKAFKNYELYRKSGMKFKDAILDFQRLVEGISKSIDFINLWNLYKLRAEESTSTNKEGEIGMNSHLKAIETTGVELLQTIETVKSTLDKCAEEASCIDAIECAKDQMLGGEELMTTDKFSAPGKYRRNMNHLRKCMRYIGDAELETNEILRSLQFYFDEHCEKSLLSVHSLSYARESIIIPEEKHNEQDLEDIFSNLSQESMSIAMSDCDENSLNDNVDDERPSSPLPPVDIQVNSDITDHVCIESEGGRDQDDVYVDVQLANGENYLDSTQVSNEISNNKELDFDKITLSRGSGSITSVEKDSPDGADELHSLPQVHLDTRHENNQVTYENTGILEEMIDADNESVELEYTPAILEQVHETPTKRTTIGWNIELESASDILKSSDAMVPIEEEVNRSISEELITADESYLDLECTLDVSESLPEDSGFESPQENNEFKFEHNLPSTARYNVDVEQQYPPLSERIIGLTKTDNHASFPENGIDKEPGQSSDKIVQSSDDDKKDYSIIDFEIKNNLDGDDNNQSIFEEIFDTKEIVVESHTDCSHEQLEVEYMSHPPSFDLELESVDVPECDTNSNESKTTISTCSLTEKEASVQVDTSNDNIPYSDINTTFENGKPDSVDHSEIGYTVSTPLTKTVPSTPYCLNDNRNSTIIVLDVQPDIDEMIHVSCSELKNLNGVAKLVDMLSSYDSCEEIEIQKGCGTSELSNASVTFEEIHNDFSDSEGYSDTTSIQEIQIFSPIKSYTSPTRTNTVKIADEPILQCESNALPTENSSSTSEVDTALKVLKVAISSDDVQDEYVDLLCSSISRVLGDEEDKPSDANLNSYESLHSSHEESSVHKSFQLSREVIDWVGTHFQSDESGHFDNMVDNSDEETERCIVVPVEKGSLHSPHIISHTIFKSEKNSVKNGDLVKTVNVSVEDIAADEPVEVSTSDDKLTQTFVIKSVSETKEASGVLFPLGSPPLRCHTPPCDIDMEPDHNTLDYGNYVFIDPSTGDIQVMRNRSRSLDSLVSMASSRSSISRFGSFEFVTDFEINIAEKNQELMKGN